MQGGHAALNFGRRVVYWWFEEFEGTLITTMRIGRYFILLMLFATALRAADFAWNLERFEGRDYVTLQQIVEFYGFTTPLAPVNNVINLETDKAQLQITLNSR